METSRSDPGAQTTYWKRFLEAVRVATRFPQAGRAFLQTALHPWSANNDTDSQHALSILLDLFILYPTGNRSHLSADGALPRPGLCFLPADDF